jgi:putative ABC transport system permease protein
MDVTTLLFTMAVAVVTGMLFGLVPVWMTSKTNLNETLKNGGRVGMSAGRNRLRKLLMISEVGLAVVLLVAAGLLVRSFVRLVNIDPGYTMNRLLYVGTSMPTSKYPRPDQRLALYLQLEEKLKAIPGVTSVGAVSRFPLSGALGVGNITSFFDIESRRKPAGQRPEMDYRIASIDYFEAMEIPLLRGRKFDTRDSTQAAIINDAAARKFWPAEDPIGQRIQFGNGANQPWVTIVGIVGNVRHVGLDIEPRPEVYRPYPNNPLTGPQLAIRTKTDPRGVIDAVRSEIRSLDADMPVRIFTVENLAQLSTAQRRFSMMLVGIFAALAMTLSIVGIYGLMSYAVSQRTHEIGLRIALGAQTPQVLRMIVGEGLALTISGLAAGIACAIAVTRGMSGLLFGITNTDPVTYLIVCAVLTAVALLACYIPARRASRVDPLVALRHE